MKKVAVIIFVLLIVSCSTNSNDNGLAEVKDMIIIEGTYSYLDPNCEGYNTAICTDYIEFLSDAQISVILRENNIVYVTEYSLQNNIITLKKVPVSNSIMSFKIENDSTLKRLENSTFWKK